MSTVNAEKDPTKVHVIGYVLLKTELIPNLENHTAVQREFFDDFLNFVPKENRFEETFKNVLVEGDNFNARTELVYIKTPWSRINLTQAFMIAITALEIPIHNAHERCEEVKVKLEDLWSMSDNQLENLQVMWNLKGEK
jgi:hypothetical protein